MAATCKANYSAFGFKDGVLQQGLSNTEKTMMLEHVANKPLLIIPKDENYQTISYPPFISSLGTEAGRVELPNKFLEQLYLKYPSLLPKRIPPTHKERLCYEPDEDQFVSMYKKDFITLAERQKNDLFLYRSPGLHSSSVYTTSAKYEFRDPETGYLPGIWLPISTEQDRSWPFTRPPNAPKKPEKKKPLSSEYNDNINRMAKMFKKIGVYKKSSVFIKHQNTMPPFEKL